MELHKKKISDILQTPHKLGYSLDVLCPPPQRKVLAHKDELKAWAVENVRELTSESVPEKEKTILQEALWLSKKINKKKIDSLEDFIVKGFETESKNLIKVVLAAFLIDRFELTEEDLK